MTKEKITIEVTKKQKSYLEWLLNKGMEVTKSNKKHAFFDETLAKVKNNNFYCWTDDCKHEKCDVQCEDCKNDTNNKR